MNKLNGTKAEDRKLPDYQGANCCEKAAEDIFPQNEQQFVNMLQQMFPGASIQKLSEDDMAKHIADKANYVQKLGPVGPHQFTTSFKEPVRLSNIATTNTKDMVNNPPHYNTGGIEAIEAIEASMSEDEYKGFLKGTVLKYVWRYRYKGSPKEDLQKAEWYLKKLIELY